MQPEQFRVILQAIPTLPPDQINVLHKTLPPLPDSDKTQEKSGKPRLLERLKYYFDQHPFCLHSWHLYSIRLHEDAKMTRDVFIERMFEQGIGCSVHYILLHLHPYWSNTYQLKPEVFPNSQRIDDDERSASLLIYSKMTDLEVERVIKAVTVALN